MSRILVTNDDGVHAPGLLALADALSGAGDVLVVAPATNQTGASRAISLAGPVEVDEVELPGGRRAFAVGGTPVDCVRFALLGLAGDPPECVCSGINAGVNLGDDLTYSGTVAAAMEGLLEGLPSIAFSQQSLARSVRGWEGEFDYRALATFAGRLVPAVLERGLPDGVLLNVNGPGLLPGDVMGARVRPLGRRVFRVAAVSAPHDGGRRHYHLYDTGPDWHDEDGTDFAAIAEGCFAITPVHLDLTDRAALEALGSLDLDALARA
jgi:5'-nucleotidase